MEHAISVGVAVRHRPLGVFCCFAVYCNFGIPRNRSVEILWQSAAPLMYDAEIRMYACAQRCYDTREQLMPLRAER
jgi:hypothetical protein